MTCIYRSKYSFGAGGPRANDICIVHQILRDNMGNVIYMITPAYEIAKKVTYFVFNDMVSDLAN